MLFWTRHFYYYMKFSRTRKNAAKKADVVEELGESGEIFESFEKAREEKYIYLESNKTMREIKSLRRKPRMCID